MQNNVNIYDTLNTFNQITKDYVNKRIQDFEHPKNDFIDLLRSKAATVPCNTEGDYETFIADSYNFSTVPGGRNVTLPDGRNEVSSAKIALAVKQFYANAELTDHDFRFKNSDAGTYIKVVDRALSGLLEGVKWYLSIMAFGNGTGQIATIGTTGSAVSSGSTGTAVCNNTYLDLGFDNVVNFREGIYVDFYRGTTLKGTGKVTKVNRTALRAADNTQTGSFEFVNISESSYTPTQNDKVFVAGAYGSDNIIQGIRQIVNPAVGNLWGVASDSVFEGLYLGKKGSATTVARNSASNVVSEIFRSKVWRSNADGSAIGLLDSSNIGTYTGAGLADWDMGTLREIMAEVDYYSRNSGRVNVLLMNQFMADMVFKIAEDKQGIWNGLGQVEADSMIGKDVLRARGIRKEDGSVIPIIVTEWMPSNEIMGLCTDDLFVLTSGAFGFLGREGGVWEHSWANNKNNFQAPYEGYINIGAYRCDKCFTIQGLKDIRN